MPQNKINRPLRIRLFSNLLAIVLVLISLAMLKLHTGGFWIFTWVVCVVLTIVFVTQHFFLTLFLKQKSVWSVWRNLCFWLGFLAALYIATLMLQYGVSEAKSVGLFALTLLALSLFFHGLFDDLSTALTGIGLALMIAGALVIEAYLFFVIIPIAIIVGFLIITLRKNNQTRNTT